jgi:type VI secretion system VasD/TssJ family lipoprotein
MRTAMNLNVAADGRTGRASRGRARPWGTGLVFLLLTAALFLPASCENKIEKIEEWPYQERAIKIKYKADPDLNIHDEKDHTLFVCIYQLIDPNAFRDNTSSRDGVVKLLSCERFDQSFASADRLVVHPGGEEIKTYSRAENAQWVGIVAGYYNLWPEHVHELVQVPTKVEKSGIFFKKEKMVPGPLNLNLYFGPEEIQRIVE